jgi:hypothetical protein
MLWLVGRFGSDNMLICIWLFTTLAGGGGFGGLTAWLKCTVMYFSFICGLSFVSQLFSGEGALPKAIILIPMKNI